MNAILKCFTPSKIFPGQNGAPFATRFLFRKLLHFRGTKKNKCLPSLLIRKQTSIFVWHSATKCVLGYTLLRNQFAALQARICAECCHVKRINQSNMEILRNNRLINDIVNVSC